MEVFFKDNRESVLFFSINVGEAFYQENGRAYLRISRENPYNCVCLNDGTELFFTDDKQVYRAKNMKVVIER